MDYEKSWMKRAIELAFLAYRGGEIPVGAVIVYKDKIIGEGYNLRERFQDPLLHAEIVAIREASKYLGSWRLSECELYVTKEPCAMCAGAIVNSRIKRVIIGCLDPKGGGMLSVYSIGVDGRLNHKVEIIYGVEEEVTSSLLKSFFEIRR